MGWSKRSRIEVLILGKGGGRESEEGKEEELWSESTLEGRVDSLLLRDQ